MAEIKSTEMIRDALGSPIPQKWDEESQTFIASTVDGSAADVDFSKKKMIRDRLGSPIPQRWDNDAGKFVPSAGGVDGEVTIESIPGLQTKLDETTVKLADTEKQFKSTSENESAQVGTELVDSTGWILPTGWTGDFATGFKNTKGNTNPLRRTMPATETKLFLVEFRVESPTPSGIPNASTDFTVSIGNTAPFITYRGGGNFNYSFGIQSVSDGDLVFTPGATFDGTIKNVSVKQITETTNPTTQIKDSTNKNVIEIRPTKANLRNTFIGIGVGKSNLNGDTNTIVGNGSFEKNTSGYWNTGVGADALKHNTTGSRNIAIGHLALEYNVSGDRNVAIGTFAIERNTTGRQNIGIGADALFENTTGSRNIAIGMGALGSNNGDQHIAIGYSALSSMVDQSDSIAIGTEALKLATIQGGIAIGKWAGKNATTADNTIIGFDAHSNATTASANVIIGKNGMRGNLTGVNNVAIGQSAMQGINGNYSVNRNTVVGAFAGWGMQTGADNNTLIGMESGNSITTGNNNIMIGRQANPTSATANNQLNIGNVLYGNLLNKRIGIGVILPSAKLHVMAGTATEGQFMLDAGVLKTTPLNGVMEYDGTNLYFTINGVRKTIQMA